MRYIFSQLFYNGLPSFRTLNSFTYIFSLHHYGTLNRGDRLAKYNTYLNEDTKFKERSSLYEYLLDENVELKVVSQLRV